MRQLYNRVATTVLVAWALTIPELVRTAPTWVGTQPVPSRFPRRLTFPSSTPSDCRDIALRTEISSIGGEAQHGPNWSAW